jgi:tetratricopeptide (TPR) repeat protein
MGCLNLTGRGLSVIIALPCLLAVAVLAGCSAKSDTAAAAPDPAKEQEALMNQGMEALNARNNATEAAALFRKVLDLNPTHYGATYQLATALERSGRPDEACPAWERILGMAERINDKPTAGEAVQHVLMCRGLALLNKEYDPEQAGVLFQKVLEANPDHYGATFRLATCLDLAGRPTEARLVWERMLAMAEQIGDGETAATAKARLAKLDAADENAFMYAGLRAFYKQKNPAEASAFFRRVLAASPSHYGATYQLAAALDAAGKPEEAMPYWAKALAMAEKSNDQTTISKARARLQKLP